MSHISDQHHLVKPAVAAAMRAGCGPHAAAMPAPTTSAAPFRCWGHMTPAVLGVCRGHAYLHPFGVGVLGSHAVLGVSARDARLHAGRGPPESPVFTRVKRRRTRGSRHRISGAGPPPSTAAKRLSRSPRLHAALAPRGRQRALYGLSLLSMTGLGDFSLRSPLRSSHCMSPLLSPLRRLIDRSRSPLLATPRAL